MRYTLKLLLIYKGFLTETPGKGISLPTKIWGALVKGEFCLLSIVFNEFLNVITLDYTLRSFRQLEFTVALQFSRFFAAIAATKSQPNGGKVFEINAAASR
jgi:hypothetical protein